MKNQFRSADQQTVATIEKDKIVIVCEKLPLTKTLTVAGTIKLVAVSNNRMWVAVVIDDGLRGFTLRVFIPEVDGWTNVTTFAGLRHVIEVEWDESEGLYPPRGLNALIHQDGPVRFEPDRNGWVRLQLQSSR